MNIVQRTFEHYRDYHAYGPPRLKYMGILGALTFFAFYFLRFTRPDPQPLDDLPLRLGVLAVMALLALKDRWPERLKRHYIPFSWWAMLYSLPFFTAYTGLERGGGVPALSNGFIALCFLTLLTDWRNTFLMLFLGTGLAVALFGVTHPGVPIPRDMVAQVPAYLVIAVGANLFKFSTEQIEAERKLRHTQALAGSIAHELRHPLAQVRHSLEAVQRVLPAPGTSGQLAHLDDQQLDRLYRHLSHGEQAIARGLQVVSMTLDEVSARPLDTSSFTYLSAAEVVHKAVDEYGYESGDARSRVEVRVEEDFQFRGDETAYLFVLFNLLMNALDHVGPFPDTLVTLPDGRREVSERDNGPGIPREKLATLFEPFRSAGKAGGTGLGLAYCQRVMKSFGGSIHCESAVGKFTEFTMRFPPAGAQEQEAFQAHLLDSARATLAGRRLLLVEDDDVQREATRRKLQPLGVQVDEAADGQRALALLARHVYDLVLLDLRMPVLDGYQLALKVRQGQVPANRDVRIVAHTSEPAHVAKVKTQRAGIDEFVAKPSSRASLAQALHRASSRTSATTPAEARPLAGRRILLADDSAFNRRTVAAYLKEAGAEVLQAEHGVAVLQQLGTGPGFDAVLMDLHMPGLDGLEAARAIRAGTQPWSCVPIVALTAHSDSPAIEGALAAGMNAFLVKPVEAHQLYEALRAVVECRADAPLAPAVPVQPPLLPSTGPLLNDARLQSYVRLGLLEELVSEYLPEITRLVGELATAARAQDLQRVQETLHALLGMSGEAGALALYRLVRHIYMPVLQERRWPADEDWLQQIEQVAQRTDEALRGWRGQPLAPRAS